MNIDNLKKYLPNIIFLIVGMIIGLSIGFLFSNSNKIADANKEEEILEESINEEEVNVDNADQELIDFYNNHLLKTVNSKVGDTITYGSYEQDNNKENGKEDIEWIVLYKSNKNSILLVSKKILDAMPYNIDKKEITWKDSGIRDFLNKEFYNNAFNDYEKILIMENEMSNNQNANYKTDGGENTIDKVFLLSENQANKYFKKEKKEYRARSAEPTLYAIDRGLYIEKENEDWDKNNAAFWLRTPGIDNTRAELVESNGQIFIYGEEVSNVEVGLRPCIWIKY